MMIRKENWENDKGYAKHQNHLFEYIIQANVSVLLLELLTDDRKIIHENIIE